VLVRYDQAALGLLMSCLPFLVLVLTLLSAVPSLWASLWTTYAQQHGRDIPPGLLVLLPWWKRGLIALRNDPRALDFLRAPSLQVRCCALVCATISVTGHWSLDVHKATQLPRSHGIALKSSWATTAFGWYIMVHQRRLFARFSASARGRVCSSLQVLTLQQFDPPTPIPSLCHESRSRRMEARLGMAPATE
jgi:hypothetical protein